MDMPTGEKFKQQYKERNKKYTVMWSLYRLNKRLGNLCLTFWIGSYLLFGQILFDLSKIIYPCGRYSANHCFDSVNIFNGIANGIGVFDKIAYYGGGGSFAY